MLNRNPMVVSIAHVSHCYGKTRALEAVTVEIPAGRMVGLLGPDGVGKSTLLGLLAGARKMQAGTIQVLGGDMADVQHRTAVGLRIAYMPQGLGKNLYAELSVFENLDFFGQLFAQSVAERRARDGFWELLIELSRQEGITIFISTHFMNEAMRCDRISLMHAGTVFAADTPAALQRARSAASLEDAFIGYLEEAIAATAGEPPATAVSQPPGTPVSQGTPVNVCRARACGSAATPGL